MILTYRLAQLLEMVQQRLVVDLIVDVEAVPQVATDDDASEAEVLHCFDGVEIHTAQGIHLLVDEAILGGLL